MLITYCDMGKLFTPCPRNDVAPSTSRLTPHASCLTPHTWPEVKNIYSNYHYSNCYYNKIIIFEF